MAEQYLLDKYKNDNFPVVIIRPGNVYGPCATTWVLRPLKAIQKNRISLINKGKGIFLHTYIDNLIDALLVTMRESKAVGESINITDGDYSVTWKRYLNDLSHMVGKRPIQRNMSKNSALFFSKIMMLFYKIFGIEPWVTSTAINIFTNDKKISIEKARKILGYTPKINYDVGMEKIRKWLQNEHII
jgi:nucleoside-diphosphate-sugar epimerase